MSLPKVALYGFKQKHNQFSRALANYKVHYVYRSDKDSIPDPSMKFEAVILCTAQISHQRFWKIKDICKHYNIPCYISEAGFTRIKEVFDKKFLLKEKPVEVFQEILKEPIEEKKMSKKRKKFTAEERYKFRAAVKDLVENKGFLGYSTDMIEHLTEMGFKSPNGGPINSSMISAAYKALYFSTNAKEIREKIPNALAIKQGINGAYRHRIIKYLRDNEFLYVEDLHNILGRGSSMHKEIQSMVNIATLIRCTEGRKVFYCTPEVYQRYKSVGLNPSIKGWKRNRKTVSEEISQEKVEESEDTVQETVTTSGHLLIESEKETAPVEVIEKEALKEDSLEESILDELILSIAGNENLSPKARLLGLKKLLD